MEVELSYYDVLRIRMSSEVSILVMSLELLLNQFELFKSMMATYNCFFIVNAFE